MSMAKEKPGVVGGADWRAGASGCRPVSCWRGSIRCMLRMHTVCGPVFHCYSCPLATFACPIGVLANFSALHLFPFVAIGHAGGGRACCWAASSAAGSARSASCRTWWPKCPTPKFTLPDWMGYLRYVVLIVFVLAAAVFARRRTLVVLLPPLPGRGIGGRVAQHGADWRSRASRSSGRALAKTAIFLVILVAMFFTWRPWCTLFCPLGAIYGLFNRVSLVFLGFQPNNAATANCVATCAAIEEFATARQRDPLCPLSRLHPLQRDHGLQRVLSRRQRHDDTGKKQDPTQLPTCRPVLQKARATRRCLDALAR